VGDTAPEPGGGGGDLVDVERIEVAGQPGEEVDVGGFDRASGGDDRLPRNEVLERLAGECLHGIGRYIPRTASASIVSP
jgi:hypothetical protein